MRVPPGFSRLPELPSWSGRALVEIAYRSPTARRLSVALLPEARVGQLFVHLLLRGYRDFDGSSGVRESVFARDFELFQAAEVLGTVGTFHGRAALRTVVGELQEAFGGIGFSPAFALPVDAGRVILAVRFTATGLASTVSTDRLIGHYWRRDGHEASRLEVYWELDEALSAAGVARRDAQAGDGARSASGSA